MSTPDTSTLAGQRDIIQAAIDAKRLQWCHKNGEMRGQWKDLAYADHPFDFSRFDYRIKPQEPLRCWVNIYSDRFGCVRRSAESCFKGTTVAKDAIRAAVPLIELTTEVEAALKAAGVLP